MALAWVILRADPAEAQLAQLAFSEIVSSGAQVPALWFAEVANTLLVFERAKRISETDSTSFLADLKQMTIVQEAEAPADLQMRVMDLGRRYKLTAYDATYLELAMRRGATLATFDRQLADAARSAGTPVFGEEQ
jgi:predicted nucleic acid-binding protein